ncbi:MAG: T9SS type A sorting domain-containing protein, partial [Candidatus Cloacimonetes bacterium]|nr:T9SS type A sorting domain-containing protein [Candidatus Cloacimonadota bacterium]
AVSEGTDIILSWLIPGNETENSQHEENQIIDHEREENKTRIKSTEDENNRDLTGYRVYKNDVQIAFINNYLTTSYTDQHQPEDEYSYYVTALYTEGESEPSEVLVYNHILPAPQNLVASETPNHLHVLLTWNAPETIEPVTCYRVYLNDGLLAEVTLMAYLHTNAPPGTLVYQVTAVYEDLESGAATAIIEHSDAFNPIIPVKTELMANYPNPFNPDTSIGFALKTSGEVVIQIFNLKGEKVKKLVNNYLEAGFHNVIWDGCDENKSPVSSGIYLYQMKTEAYSSTRKMMLMK